MPQSRRIYNKMPTPFHIECEGGNSGRGRKGSSPLAAGIKLWGAETAHIAVPPPDKQSFHGNWGMRGRGLCISAISPAPSNNLSNYGRNLHFIKQEFGSDWERIEVTFNSSSD